MVGRDLLDAAAAGRAKEDDQSNWDWPNLMLGGQGVKTEAEQGTRLFGDEFSREWTTRMAANCWRWG
jgi:hypothetical protein